MSAYWETRGALLDQWIASRLRGMATALERAADWITRESGAES